MILNNSMRKLLLLIFCFGTTMLWGQQPKLILPVGHTYEVLSAQFSPDDKRIVTASGDYTVKLWDAYSGMLLAELIGHEKSVNSARFSPNGKKIITTSDDGTIRLWDATTAKLITILKEHTLPIYSARFSPDGKMIIAASDNNYVVIWDSETGKPIRILKGHTGPVYFVWFSSDGKKIVTASYDKKAKVWDASNGKLIVTLNGHSKAIYSARFSPDNSKILTSSNDRTARIWDAVSGKVIKVLNNHLAGFETAIFSANGEKIITACPDSAANIWDALTGKLLLRLKGHSNLINGVGFLQGDKKIATASKDMTIKIWDAFSGKLLNTLEGHTHFVYMCVPSADNKKIISNSYDFTAKIWDINSGKLLVDLKGRANNCLNAEFSPDGKKIVVSSGDTSTKIWDINTGMLITQLKGHDSWVNSSRFSPDGQKILTASDDGTAKVWDAITGKILINIEGHEQKIYKARYSSNGKKIITASYDSSAKIWDASSGKLLVQLRGHNEWVSDAVFSPDGEKVITASGDNTAKIWDTESGKPVAILKGHIGGIYTCGFSVDGKKMFTGSRDSTLIIWETSSNKNLLSIKMSDYVVNAEISPDSKLIIVSSTDKAARIYDIETGLLKEIIEPVKGGFFKAIDWKNNHFIFRNNNETTLYFRQGGKAIFTFVSVDSLEYFVHIPSGYFMSSPLASKLLHYTTPDLKIITFEQLDVKYNRPDKILEAIGNTDTALIRSYRKAYEKRIKKLGIDTTAFRNGYSVPEADFANRDIIKYEQNEGKLKLNIKSVDSTYKLDRFNIWINESPIYGQRGISLRNKNKNRFDSTITIELSQGENKIETSISNVNGTESYRMPLLVNYTPADSQPTRTYFIGIGIDQFADSKYNLKYSTKDIRDLANKLKEKYPDIIIDTLFNDSVTISNVKTLKQKLLQTSVNDKVIISYSGHGMLSKDFDYYLSTYAVNFDKPEENGLPYDELENLLDSIPARKKLMLIDACHSGEVDKDDLVAMNATDKQLIKGLKPVAYKKEGQLGLKNSFELMQSLFVNVGKSTGATIISAAAGTEFALEGVNKLPNGVFTYCILEAMEKYPSMKISELKKRVGERVVELTKGLQKPTSRNETIAVDWNVW